MRFLALAVIAALSACTVAKPRGSALTDATAPAELTGQAKRQWIVKTSKALRYGKGVALNEMPALEEKSREEIVDLFMSDIAFADTLLDFSLYFLGAKPDSLYTTNADGSRRYTYTQISDGTFTFIQDQFYPAVSAAIEGYKGGDILHLIGPDFKTWFPVESNLGMAPETVARVAEMDAAITLAAAAEGATRTTVCAKINEFNDATQVFQGLPYQITESEFGLNNLKYAFQGMCFQTDGGGDVASVAAAVSAFAAVVKKMDASLTRPDAVSGGGTKSILDLYGMTLTGNKAANFFGGHFWGTNPNSSTNFNRRRAKAVLKTYFCDDLTPLDVVSSDIGGEGEGAHASNKACQACHYKLDPMGGFFREHGAGGFRQAPADGGDSMSIFFDDGTSLDGDALKSYLSAWRFKSDQTPPTPATEWNVGYIRAKPNSEFESLNQYGKSLDDLIGTIRKSPDAKKCVVKRMSEYFLGPQQVYDEGWIAHLQKRMNAAPTSGQGAKLVIKDLVLSNTFSKKDPDAGACYDFAPNTAASTLPCRVAFVMDKYCLTCHEGEGAEKGLDLASWAVGDDGVSAFNHVREGVQVPRAETLKLIIERLSTDDPALAMPANMFMPAVDRQELYKWVQGQVSTSN